MTQSASAVQCCKDSISRLSRIKQLPNAISSSQLASILAKAAASGLVIASAGLGAVFAWSIGNGHGAMLGALFVTMAVALEIAKPLAVAATVSLFRQWSIVSGTALALLALVAIAYSLTAEITLMAGARGDVVAQREAVLKASADVDLEAQRIRSRFELAKSELARVPVTRPANELQAEIAAIERLPGIMIGDEPCGGISNGRVTHTWCPRRSALLAEMARAERRAQLEVILAEPLSVVALESTAAVKDADPGAAALSTYLMALGLAVDVNVLTKWLVLVPVVALEIGSSLAVVLVQATSQRRPVRASQPYSESVDGPPMDQAMVQMVQDNEIEASGSTAGVRERAQRTILNQLKKQGGSVSASERGLAALIGASRPTVRRAIHGLMAGGFIALEVTKGGTMLRLITEARQRCAPFG